MKQPVPPWDPQSFRNLSEYLSLPLAEIARLIGIYPLTVSLWHKRKTNRIFKRVLAKLLAFEPKIPKLREAALKRAKARVEEAASKEQRKRDPVGINREELSFLQCFLGASQFEISLLLGVSYDTVTSWFNGRRKVTQKKHCEEIRSIISWFRGRKPTLDILPDSGGHNPLTQFTIKEWQGDWPEIKDLEGTYRIVSCESPVRDFALLRKPVSFKLVPKPEGIFKMVSPKKDFNLEFHPFPVRVRGEAFETYRVQSDSDPKTFCALCFFRTFGILLRLAPDQPVVRFLFILSDRK